MPEQMETAQVTTPPVSDDHRLQKRHTIAALVYFLYGLFYLFGAQYLTTMGMSARGMSHSKLWFGIGTIVLILFPYLIYKRFAIGLSVWSKARRQSQTLWINFTLLLALAVGVKIYALLRDGLYTITPLHTAGLIVVVINTISLLWAGLSKPLWITRHS
jgi:hypothetical protein